MKTLTTLLCMLFIFTATYAQVLETLGAGVIDFLLTNPKTASQNNATETAALNVISGLLKVTASRKHDMNVANAGRSEIVFNTTSGNQATVYSDTQGNVYLLYNGTIYPISAGLVNQARTVVQPKIKNSTLPAYNISELKDEYRFEKEETLEEHFLQQDKISCVEFAKKMNVSHIYIKKVKNIEEGVVTYKLWLGYDLIEVDLYAKKLPADKNLRRVNSGKYKGYCKYGVYAGSNNVYSMFIPRQLYKHEIRTTFMCNWKKDFDEDGLDFDDFQGVKRSFYEGEKLLFVLGYTTETAGTWKFEIYAAASGETVYKKTGAATKGAQVVTAEKDGDKLPIGVYIYNFTLTADGQDKVSKSEKFEILEDTDKKYASPTTD